MAINLKRTAALVLTTALTLFSGCRRSDNSSISTASENSGFSEAVGSSDIENSEKTSSFIESNPYETSRLNSEENIEPDVDDIKKRLSEMTLKEKVYQMFFVTPEQITDSGEALTAFDLSEKPVGGVLLMGANLQSVEQTRKMLSDTQNNALQRGIGVFLAVDEEGGKVARCADNLGTTAFEPMEVYGSRNDYNEAFNIGKTIGADLRELGFNVDFAPVADVDISPTNELGDRIFSADPEVCANMVSGVVSGLNVSGAAAALKHFPGLGAEDGNTHTESEIVIDRTLNELRSCEFVPFSRGIKAGADFVMVGHQKVSAFGDDLPADLSYTAVTEMLRGELGFNGIAITDAQNMNTISSVYYSSTAAKLAINAGIDMILAPEDLELAVNGVISAIDSGEITEAQIDESLTRILSLKHRMGLLK